MKLLLLTLFLLGCSSTKNREKLQTVAALTPEEVQREEAAPEAPPVDYIRENFFLVLNDCRSNEVDMKTGRHTSKKSETYTVGCRVDAANVANCLFFDSKQNLFGQRGFVNGIVDSQALITSEGNMDLYIVDLTTRKVYARTVLNEGEGHVRGAQTCGGDLVFEGEIR